MDINSCMRKLNRENDTVKVYSKTLNGSPYYMYIMFIPYREYRNIISKYS